MPIKPTSFRFCLLVLIALPVVLSCSRTSSSDKVVIEKETEPAAIRTKYHVVCISGFESDPTGAQISGKSPRGVGNSGMFQLKCDLVAKGLDCTFYNWNGTDAGSIHDKDAPGFARIASRMREQFQREPNTQFLLLGHSWGGHTLLEVANQLQQESKLKIVHAIVIDPSSLMRGKRIEKLPNNIPSMLNYHTANAFCWGAWKNETRVKNVDLGDPVNGFSINGQPNYGSAFDTHAHTAAEWDENIHKDVVRRVLEIVVLSQQ